MGQTISHFKKIINISDKPFVIPEICTEESDDEIKNCPKPHHQYIPVNKFTMDSLPEKLRNKDTIQLVTSLANLTVKIISPMKQTKIERIKQKLIFFVKNIRLLYLSKGQMNQRLLKIHEKEEASFQSLEGYLTRYGSGRVADVIKASKEDELTYPCSKYKNTNDKKKELWIVLVFTATHIVPDTAAAKRTRCVLFYDNEEAQKEIIYGTKVQWCHKNGDLCLFHCVTCNEDLVNKLQKNLEEFNKAWQSLRERVNNLDCRKLLRNNCEIVIVSHPHGKAKKISLGKIDTIQPPVNPETNELALNCEYQLQYQVSTCPGSSGAPVYVDGINYFKLEFVHNGTIKEGNQSKNVSTCWLLEERDLMENLS